MKYVTFSKAKLMRLKRAYEKAKAEEKEIFTFEDREYVILYAKYLIEYLEKKLSR